MPARSPAGHVYSEAHRDVSLSSQVIFFKEGGWGILSRKILLKQTPYENVLI